MPHGRQEPPGVGEQHLHKLTGGLGSVHLLRRRAANVQGSLQVAEGLEQEGRAASSLKVILRRVVLVALLEPLNKILPRRSIELRSAYHGHLTHSEVSDS